MIAYDEALWRVLDAVSPLQPIVRPLGEAAGHILTSSAIAIWDMPRCVNSSMDGFAIAGDLTSPGTALEIIGASFAGHPFIGEVQPGQTVRITTGAPIPKGADTVVPVEQAEERKGKVLLTTTQKNSQYVRYKGEEFRAADVLIEPGGFLRAGEIALLASAGVEQVFVFPRLQIPPRDGHPCRSANGSRHQGP